METAKTDIFARNIPPKMQMSGMSGIEDSEIQANVHKGCVYCGGEEVRYSRIDKTYACTNCGGVQMENFNGRKLLTPEDIDGHADICGREILQKIHEDYSIENM
jgi:hypothetical protein